MFLTLLILAGVKFFLKKKEYFFCGTLPSMNRAGGRASIRTRQSKTIFAGEKDLLCLGSFCFGGASSAQEGAGEMRGGF